MGGIFYYQHNLRLTFFSWKLYFFYLKIKVLRNSDSTSSLYWTMKVSYSAAIPSKLDINGVRALFSVLYEHAANHCHAAVVLLMRSFLDARNNICRSVLLSKTSLLRFFRRCNETFPLFNAKQWHWR